MAFDFDNSLAIWLVQGRGKEASLYDVQKLLGHSGANVTQIYNHLKPDQMHDTVDRLAITMN